MTPTQRKELKRSATEEPETRVLSKRLAKSPQDGDVGPSWNRLSSSVPPEDSLIEHGGGILDLDNEDEDDIPYTHRSTSRSQSPLFLGSDTIDGETSPASGIGERNKTPRDQHVISLDDEDDDIKEYYVISDSEEEEGEEGEVDEQTGEDGEDQVKHKTTTEQLQENQKSIDSKISDAHCAVCFDSPEQSYVLPCGHLYCGDCVFKALSSTKQSTRTGGPCSLCRTYTPYKKIILATFKKKRKALV